MTLQAVEPMTEAEARRITERILPEWVWTR